MRAAQLTDRASLSPGDAVGRVVGQLFHTGSPTNRATEAVAEELIAEGVDPGQARIEAARATLQLKSRRLAEREGVSKTVDPGMAGLAVSPRSARVWQNLSQADGEAGQGDRPPREQLGGGPEAAVPGERLPARPRSSMYRRPGALCSERSGQPYPG